MRFIICTAEHLNIYTKFKKIQLEKIVFLFAPFNPSGVELWKISS